MDRRAFIKSMGVAAGALGVGGVATACSGGNSGIPDADQTLSVIVASFEVLTGEGQRIPFGLRSAANAEVADAPVQVWLRGADQRVLGGPFPATYVQEESVAGGLYQTELDLPDAGTFELVAVAETPDGRAKGAAALRVVTPEQSEAPVPGAPATKAETPTTEEPLDFAAICTQDPPCSMHEVSLDAALAQGQPVVLLFATPKFCQTAMCGPAVATVDGVRQAGAAPDAAWIHVEIFSDDEGQVLGPPVEAWGLPTEPWLFTIDGAGTIRERLDGPMLPSVVEEMVGKLV